MSGRLQLFDEVADAARTLTVERTRLQQSSAKSSSGRTLEAVVNSIEELESKNAQWNNELTSLQDEREAHSKKREDLLNAVQRLKDKSHELDRLLADRKRYEQEILDLNKSLDGLRNEAAAIDEQLLPIRKEMEKIEAERAEVKRRNSEGEAVLHTALRELQRDYDAFEALLKSIDQFDREQGKRQEDHNRLELERGRISSKRQEADKINQTIVDIKSQIATLAVDISDMKANLEYRQIKARCILAQEDIHKKKTLLTNMTNNTSVASTIRNDQNRLILLREKRASLRGEINEKYTTC